MPPSKLRLRSTGQGCKELTAQELKSRVESSQLRPRPTGSGEGVSSLPAWPRFSSSRLCAASYRRTARCVTQAGVQGSSVSCLHQHRVSGCSAWVKGI